MLRDPLDIRHAALAILLIASSALASLPASALSSYTNFETVPVRPLALSADGSRLFAVNTPDDRLEVFDVSALGLRHVASVPVGVDPVAVAARSDSEVWVVNHLSDSVSIVDVAANPPRVVRTLLVGDEPWDVVFAGPRDGRRGPYRRAFISAARRGQNHPENPNAELKTPGIGRADVWVFDADDLGAALGGAPETIVRLFGDKPRALAASPDGSTVYAGVFHSGNRTGAVSSGVVCDGGELRGPCTYKTALDPDAPDAVGEIGSGNPPVLPGGVPGPNVDAAGNPMLEVGVIAKFDPVARQWRDLRGRNWNGAMPYSLPDLDVFSLDALADPPVETAAWSGVGTILYQMAVDRRGRVFVANTDANNMARFEGPGVGEPTVRGHLHEARISLLDAGGGVVSRHLNKHIDYAASPMPPGTAERSLATPVALAFSRSGRTLFVAAYGSQKVGLFDVAALEKDRFSPSAHSHIELSGGGPAGLVVDPKRRRLYVYTRFDNAVSVVDVRARAEITSIPLPNPEPPVVRAGRRFLYDARLTSSNGEASCGGCHIFGDEDDLVWNLGDPTLVQRPNPNPFQFDAVIPRIFHPLKGPMATQTLRGLDDHGPMHWRGDRTGADNPASGDPFDELASFMEFNVAFDGLLGRDAGPLAEADMRAFAEFALAILPPPNPIRNLDGRDTPEQAEGRRSYIQDIHSGQGTCIGCHQLDPAQGRFGTGGLTVFDPGHFKIPQLRAIYDKVGAFGFALVNFMGNDGFDFGDQVRSVGILNDGTAGSLSEFLGFGFTFATPQQKSDVEDFVLAFPSNRAPAVGHQVTRPAGGDAAVDARVALLIGQGRRPFAIANEPGARACDLVVKGVLGGRVRGFLLDATTGKFLGDRAADLPLEPAQLAALADASGEPLTYTCAPPGSGLRAGLDRDQDGAYDGDELAAGTDPNRAGSVLGACGDGVDNDGDGATDFPADSGCGSAAGASELSDVAIDVAPGDPDNRIALVGPRLPVAILGSRALDAGDIAVKSLRFGPRAARPASVMRRLRDVNGDGFPDRIASFAPARAGLALGDGEACLSGDAAGERFLACQAIEVRLFP